ncbi:hypothetical protein V9T40_003173 [Parthenolecanium corni]|uniref:Uncharacterized protein n=1 Tax=Parthenolecanium corni TaxID=536013 RepID=A0AAN9TQ35_9HEMI
MVQILFLEKFSESESDNLECDAPKPKTMRRTNCIWLKQAVCECAKEAEEAVDKKIWEKHSLSMQIRLKLVDVPPTVKSMPLGQKRKIGIDRKVKTVHQMIQTQKK